MKIDNQLDGEDISKYGCSIYALKNQIMLDYGIYIGEDKVITALEYFAKLGAFIPGFGADATIIYPAVVKYIKWKLGLSFKIDTKNIDTMDNEKARILGFKRATKLYMQNIKDRNLTTVEIDKLVDGKQVGHFHCIKKGKVIESLNGDYFDILGNLKYAFAKGIYYYNVRRFEPDDELTRGICNKTLNISKERQQTGFKNYLVGLVELKEFINELKYPNITIL